MHESAGDSHALQLAAGKFAGHALLAVLEADCAKHLRCARLRVRAVMA